MRPPRVGAALATAVSLFAATSSALISYRTGRDSDIKFGWEVSRKGASPSSGNVYLQIDAPTSYAWVGLGVGDSMRSAKVFLMYQDGEGNVTLSTRDGRHHTMPIYDEKTNIKLLEGSKVEDGRMVANVLCSECESLDLEGTNSWVAAWLRGDPVYSTNPEAPITKHDDKTILEVNFQAATTIPDRNPFLGAMTGEANWGAVTVLHADTAGLNAIATAHGVIMIIVFAGLYPIGALVMPLFNQWFLHSASQLIAFLLMWVGVGLGGEFARKNNLFGKQAHTIVGASLVALLSIQPFLGFMHHRAFSRSQKRGTIGKIHIWYGRALMIIGIINIGLGLQFAGQSGGWVIAYSTVAGISCLSYLTAIAYSIVKRKRQGKGGPRVLYAGPAHGSALSLDPLHEWDSPSEQFERARQGQFGSVGNEQLTSTGNEQFASAGNEQFASVGNEQFAKGGNEQFARAGI